MTLRKLRNLTAHWQRKLRLKDWTIEVKWMAQSEEKGEFSDSNGYCMWQEQHKHAWIIISRKSEDIEHTLIHELLHIRWDGGRPMTRALHGDTSGKEFAINALATLLQTECSG